MEKVVAAKVIQAWVRVAVPSFILCKKIIGGDPTTVDWDDKECATRIMWKHALKIVAHDSENVFFFSKIPILFAPLFVRALLAGGTGEDEYMLYDDAGFSDATKLALWRIAAKDHFKYPCFPPSTLLKKAAVDHGFPRVRTHRAQVLALGKEIAQSNAQSNAARAAKRLKITRMLA